MQYLFQTKQIDTLFTAGQKYANKVFQIVNGSPKMCHVTQRRPLQCSTRWLLNDFRFHGMFDLLC